MTDERDRPPMPEDKLPDPLSPREAEAMGRQTDSRFRGEDVGNQVVYGDVSDSVENEDQSDAHHAEDDEHL